VHHLNQDTCISHTHSHACNVTLQSRLQGSSHNASRQKHGVVNTYYFFGLLACSSCLPVSSFTNCSADFVHGSTNLVASDVCCDSFVHMGQLACALVHMSINQSINQSFIQSINHSINQLIDQSFIHSFSQPFNYSINQSFSQSVNHAFIRSFFHSLTRSFIHSFIHSVSQSVSQSTINQSINQPTNQAINQSTNMFNVLGGNWDPTDNKVTSANSSRQHCFLHAKQPPRKTTQVLGSHKVIKSAMAQQCCRRSKCCNLIWLCAGQSNTKCCSCSTQSNDLHTRHSLSVLFRRTPSDQRPVSIRRQPYTCKSAFCLTHT